MAKVLHWYCTEKINAGKVASSTQAAGPMQTSDFVWPTNFHSCFGRQESFQYKFLFEMCRLLSYWPTKLKFCPTSCHL